MADDQGKAILFVDCAPWFGGAQRSLLTLLIGLQEVGFRPLLVCADSSPGGLLESSRRHNIPAWAFQGRHWPCSLGGYFSYLRDRRRIRAPLAEAFAHTLPSLIHANGIRSGLLLLDQVPSAIPSVLHVRDLRAPLPAMRLAASDAVRVLAISHCVAAAWLRVTDPAKVRILRNGVDLDQVAATVPAAELSGAAKTGLVAVNVADFVTWKRHDLFLEAVRAARDRIPGLRGVIVGRTLTSAGEALLYRLREHALAAGLEETVRFVTDAGNALPWVAAGDLLVSTASAEPFGRAVVEALALGKPVVAVKGGGPEETLADCRAGTLVAESAQAIADGIVAWKDEALRLEAAPFATARANEFHKDRMVRDYAALYREFTGGPA